VRCLSVLLVFAGRCGQIGKVRDNKEGEGRSEKGRVGGSGTIGGIMRNRGKRGAGEFTGALILRCGHSYDAH